MHARPTPTLLLLLIAAVALAAPLTAEVNVRECIDFSSGGTWLLPANSSMLDVGTLTFNAITSSDLVVNAAVGLQAGNLAGSLVTYQIALDGVATSTFTRRNPEAFPTAIVLRDFFPNVATGQHTLTIRAQNGSPNTVWFYMFWISPLLVDSTENTISNTSSSAVTVGSTFTTLISTAITPASGEQVYLGLYDEITHGSGDNQLEFQVLRGSTVIDDYFVGVPSYLTDGFHNAYVDTTPALGANTYTVQARNLSGKTTTFGTKTLWAQTIPSDIYVWQGNASNVSVPADFNWHVVATSGFVPLPAASHGQYGVSAHGFAIASYDGPYDKEALLEFEVTAQTEGWTFEVGDLHSHPSLSSTLRLRNMMSDWEELGLVAGNDYKINLRVNGACTSTNNVGFKNIQFQELGVPTNYRFTSASCSTSPTTCCANNNPPCTVYTCAASGQLSLGTAGGLKCPIPPP
jgi:hypothetical protein